MLLVLGLHFENHCFITLECLQRVIEREKNSGGLSKGSFLTQSTKL